MYNKDLFDRLINGKPVSLYQVKNSHNTIVHITNYGCRIVSLFVNDKNKKPVDVVIGFDSIDGYLHATEVYHGATIGRCANRIAKGRFDLDNKRYQLAINNGTNHLHGGPDGFHTKLWQVEELAENYIVLSLFSADGEENYPGNVKVQVKLMVSEENEIILHYQAVTDKPTILNLTNHSYFNLNGQGNGTILDHSLQINADHFTPVNENLIPTGDIAPVAGSAFDFTSMHAVGERINNNDAQLKYPNGYDHNYVINNPDGKLAYAAKAIGDKTGITMEVHTDRPGVQFYTGNFMAGKNLIKGGVPDDFRTGFCLETQFFPDSPNQPNFPSIVLEPGQIAESTTVYKFSIAG